MAKAETTNITLPVMGTLKFTYLSTSPNPYKDGNEKIDIYSTDYRSFEVWIDQSGKLVQAGPGAGLHPNTRRTRPEDKKSQSDLRALGIKAISKLVPNFKRRMSNLHPLEDNKDREIFFFRWDDFSRPAKESEMPPFIQIALYADGELASYTNTL